jgi:hypothetical protein
MGASNASNAPSQLMAHGECIPRRSLISQGRGLFSGRRQTEGDAPLGSRLRSMYLRIVLSNPKWLFADYGQAR